VPGQGLDYQFNENKTSPNEPFLNIPWIFDWLKIQKNNG